MCLLDRRRKFKRWTFCNVLLTPPRVFREHLGYILCTVTYRGCNPLADWWKALLLSTNFFFFRCKSNVTWNNLLKHNKPHLQELGIWNLRYLYLGILWLYTVVLMHHFYFPRVDSCNMLSIDLINMVKSYRYYNWVQRDYYLNSHPIAGDTLSSIN